MKAKVFIMLAMALSFCSGAAFAQTTWIVDQGGAEDFTTIQACIDTAAAGDTCLVNAGTYSQCLYISKSLSLVAPDGPDVTIIRPGPPYPVLFPIPVAVANAEPVVIEGFTLRDGYLATAGGGLLVVGSTVTVRNCIITDNWSGYYGHVQLPYTHRGGGGIYAENSNLTVEDSVISENTSSHTMFHQPRGGAIYSWGGSLAVTNCLLLGNHASHGGGAVYVTSNATATFTNCTIAENTDGTAIGGIQVVEPAQGTVVNSILWNNEGAELMGLVTATYSDVEGGFPGTGNIDADPLFAGPGDYRLTEPSPCVDAGTNAAPLLPPEDLEGNARTMDGNCDRLFVADMGAYELFKSCPWTAAATVVTGPAGGGAVSSDASLPLNGLMALLVPLLGFLFWRGLRRNR